MRDPQDEMEMCVIPEAKTAAFYYAQPHYTEEPSSPD